MSFWAEKISLTNSLTRKKEIFQPLEKGVVKIYACGVTTYDLVHLGHARSALVQDILRRFMLDVGFRVIFVKNFTDIDDKIIKRAAEEQRDWKELTLAMIAEHDLDMQTLGIMPPDIAPRATEHLEEMITVIQRLEEKGYAYAEGGDVFFRSDLFASYGALSGKKLEDLIPGYRVKLQAEKHNTADFVLWKAAKAGEPEFSSPWGPGRPGWHIECTAMSQKYLGNHFDIHMGGSDLIFPHHENEIAQSEASSGEKFVNFWLHNEMVRINGQKMAKSLGNFILLRDLLGKVRPEVLRFYLMQTHYRQMVDFREEHLEATHTALNKLYTALNQEGGTTVENTAISPLLEEARACLADDVNTPKLLALWFEWAKKIQTTKSKFERSLFQQALRRSGNIVGLLQTEQTAWFQSAGQHTMYGDSITTEEIVAKIAERNIARKNRDFQTADAIRQELLKCGIQLKDDGATTDWQRL